MKIFKLFLLLAAVVLIMVLSDLVYFYRNEPQTLAKFFIWRASYQIKNNNLSGVIANLDRASWLYAKTNDLVYKTATRKKLQKNRLSRLSKSVQNKMSVYLKEREKYDFSVNLGPQTAIDYYNLALIAESANFSSEAIGLLTTAVTVEPESGQLYLELANLFAAEGNKTKAMEILRNCLFYPSPREQCRTALDRISRTEYFDPVGIYSESINKNL